MNPIVFNCLLLYFFVVLLSLLQSRFRIVKDDPWVFLLLFLFTPLVVAGKAKNIETWTELAGLEIFGYTLVMSFFNGKRLVPKVNEGYIYGYTLFHWYLLLDSIYFVGVNFWLALVLIASIYPTYLIFRAVFENKKLPQRDKIIIYYWFLFIIVFTYADQIALDIVKPLLSLSHVGFMPTVIILFSAVQLYFIATTFSLLFVAIPVFHMDKSSRPLKARWKEAKRDCKKLLKHKLDNYIEYQVSRVQVVYISAISLLLFWVDATYSIRTTLIIFYTMLLPLFFFYFKLTPEENLDINSTIESK